MLAVAGAAAAASPAKSAPASALGAASAWASWLIVTSLFGGGFGGAGIAAPEPLTAAALGGFFGTAIAACTRGQAV